MSDTPDSEIKNSDHSPPAEQFRLGRPVQVVTIDKEHSFVLNEDALERVLCNERIKNKHIAVVSVAGAFRKGKSFLLDFFLRYLRSHVLFQLLDVFVH